MEIGKKTIKVKNSETTNFYFIGDIHEGNCNCNHKALAEAVDIVKSDPNGYWFGMGDYIEAIIHAGDPRFDPKAISQEYAIKDLKDLPMKQAERVFNYLRPIQDKCLALIVGNHEEQYIKRHSSNIYDRFTNMFETSAHEEGKPPKKLGYIGFYEIVLQNRESKINIGFALNHGVGGNGYLEGYPISNVYKVFKYYCADINVMGHVHKLIEDVKHTVTIRNGKIRRVPKIVGVSGCFLNTFIEGNPNYYELKGGIGGESDIGMLKCGIKYIRKVKDGKELYSWDGKMEKIYL